MRTTRYVLLIMFLRPETRVIVVSVDILTGVMSLLAALTIIARTSDGASWEGRLVLLYTEYR